MGELGGQCLAQRRACEQKRSMATWQDNTRQRTCLAQSHAPDATCPNNHTRSSSPLTLPTLSSRIVAVQAHWEHRQRRNELPVAVLR
eukprot:15473601-Alexandrium_andersonii.AAC.1